MLYPLRQWRHVPHSGNADVSPTKGMTMLTHSGNADQVMLMLTHLGNADSLTIQGMPTLYPSRNVDTLLIHGMPMLYPFS